MILIILLIWHDLIIFDPITSHQLGKFSFPRQKGGNKYCIADYFCDLVSNKPTDFIPMQAVTMGSKASKYANKLFNQNSFFLFFYKEKKTQQIFSITY